MWREGEEEDVNIDSMIWKEREDSENLKRKNYTALFGELALEESVVLS
jgi:hypothetical protein